MRRLFAPLLLAFAIVLASPAAAFAVDYYVAAGGDDVANTGTLASPFASVQKAIDTAAAGGGNVYVGPGTFTGSVTLKNGVSLYGAGARETTLTVSGGSVVTINNIGAGETIAGFTITGGAAKSGGGIYCGNSSPVIKDNVIALNAVASASMMDMPAGGGIYCSGGSPTITNNIITGNTASGPYARGAGIATASSSAVISGNTIIGNSAEGGRDSACGGGISCRGGACTIASNTVADNEVSGDSASGGGVAVETGSSQIIGNVINGNLATGDMRTSGGGVYLGRSSGTVTRNVVTDNVARGEYAGGGGIEFDSGWDVYTPTISANIVTGNTADGTGSRGQGGGISCADGSPRVLGNIISGNTARSDWGTRGGGMYCSSFWDDHVSTPIITNNVVTANLAQASSGAAGAGMFFGSSPSVVRNNTIADNRTQGATPGAGGVAVDDFWAHGRPSITNCIIWGNTGAELSGIGVTYSCVEGGAAGEGNIAGNPLFSNAAAGRYDISAGSPASDVASATASPSTDIRGVVRPQGAGHDMGAYELALAIPVAPPVATDDAYTTSEDVVLSVEGLGVLANDTVAIDRGPLVASVAVEPGHGTLVLAAGGSFSYLPDGNWFGPDTFTYTVTDTSGAQDTATVTITVTSVPDAPVLDPIGDKGVDELALLTFTATATDVDLPADTLSFSLGMGAPVGAAIDSATGEFTWTPTESQGPGTSPITIVVSDGVLTDSETITVTVADVNVAPVLDPIGDKNADELAELTFTAAASDADLPENTLAFSLDTGAPAGAAIDSATGEFTWTPTEVQGPGGHDITVVVSDGVLTDSETITVTVAEVPTAPVLDPIGDKGVDELALLTFTATATDVDLPADTLSFSLGMGAPVGAAIDSATGEFTWTPTESQGPGTSPITIVVSDGVLTDSETITVTVADVNVAPVLDPIGDKNADELAELTFTAAASDADLPENTLAFSLDTGAPAGAAIDSATGEFTWTPTEVQGPGGHDITVVVSDGVLTDSETITVTVAEVPTAPVLDPIGSKGVDELALLTFTVAATDVDLPADILSFSLGADKPAGAVIDSVTGAFTWTPTEAQGPGTYEITFFTSDGPLGDSETITVAVAEVPTAPVLEPIGSKSVDELKPLLFTATATDADLPAETLVFSLGTGAPAGAAINPATGAFSWTPTEAQGPGTYTITVVVSDGVLTDSETITVAVAEVATPTKPTPSRGTGGTAAEAVAGETPAPGADPVATTSPGAEASDPTSLTPTASSADDDGESDGSPVAGESADSDDEPAVLWPLWLVLALAGIGFFAWLARRRSTKGEVS